MQKLMVEERGRTLSSQVTSGNLKCGEINKIPCQEISQEYKVIYENASRDIKANSYSTY